MSESAVMSEAFGTIVQFLEGKGFARDEAGIVKSRFSSWARLNKKLVPIEPARRKVQSRYRVADLERVWAEYTLMRSRFERN